MMMRHGKKSESVILHLFFCTLTQLTKGTSEKKQKQINKKHADKYQAPPPQHYFPLYVVSVYLIRKSYYYFKLQIPKYICNLQFWPKWLEHLTDQKILTYS